MVPRTAALEKPYTVAGWMRTCLAVWLDAATLSFSPGNIRHDRQHCIAQLAAVLGQPNDVRRIRHC